MITGSRLGLPRALASLGRNALGRDDSHQVLNGCTHTCRRDPDAIRAGRGHRIHLSNSP